MPPELSDADLDRLAQRLTDPVADNVAAQLDSGWYGQNLVLSRRQLLALGGMGLSATGLMALGVDQATAQSAAGQVGTESEPVDVFGASGEFNSVSADQLTVNADGDVEQVAVFGEAGRLRGSNRFVVPDDDSVKITNNFQSARAGFIFIKDNETNSSAIITQAASNLSIQESDGQWALSDTDGSHCVFFDPDQALVVKNRTGSSATYTLTMIDQN